MELDDKIIHSKYRAAKPRELGYATSKAMGEAGVIGEIEILPFPEDMRAAKKWGEAHKREVVKHLERISEETREALNAYSGE